MKNLIICASPRLDGNSDFVSNLITQEKKESKIIKLSSNSSKTPIQGCISCSFCEKNHGKCSLNFPNQDLVGKVFDEIFKAEQTYFISPIYFYHLPAQFKALIDRAQSYFFLPPQLKPAQNKPCKLILLGARTQGDYLFHGASLSFKYFCESLGLITPEPLCLYGLDAKDDLKNNPELCQKITNYIW